MLPLFITAALAGVLQHRWQVLGELARGPVFRKYRVEDRTTKIQAVLIQRTYESRPADSKAWKQEFLDVCKKRETWKGAEPAVLDYFTRGDCLLLVQESSPQDEPAAAAVLCSQCQTQNPDADLRCFKCGTKLSRVKVGTRFIDRFQTQQILKEYDSSISYIVHDEKEHEVRVLRELFPSNPSSVYLLPKFDQAARTLTNLAPPQLVPVFEHFTKDRRFYTVEKYPTGISTRDKAATGKPLPKERARSLFEQLLQAIKQLHNLNPSLYHGHLDGGRVLVSDDWQLMFLTDPGYLLDSVREAETPSVRALLAKDLRDIALLVLELISGIPAEKLQANKSLISESVEGLENLYLSSALEWILAGKEEKPASLEGVELLGDIINEAEARQEPYDEDAGRELLNKAYNLCGASCIRTALDKLNSQLSPELSRARDKARDFLRAFDACCGYLFPQGSSVVPTFSDQRSLIQQHFSISLSPKLSEEKWRDWMAGWRRLSYNSCALLADWIDAQPEPRIVSQDAKNAYRKLIKLADVDEIQPLLNDSFSREEHDKVGTISAVAASDKLGHIARVRNRGFRQGEHVLRKAAVLVFDRPVPVHVPPPPVKLRTVLLLLFGLAILAILATWWWTHGGSSTPPVPIEVKVPAVKTIGKPAPSQEAPKSSQKRLTFAGPPKPVEPARVQIKHFTVEPSEVPVGQPVSLSWEVVNAKTVRITGLGPEPVDVPLSDTRNVVLPPDTQQIVLEAEGAGAGNSASAPRAIHILTPPKITEFRGDPNPVPFGDPFTLRWSVIGAAHIRIDRPGLDDLPAQSTTMIQTEGTTEFMVTCTLTALSGGGAATMQVTEKVVPKIVDFSAVPTSIGQRTVWLLRWTVKGASTVSIEPDVGRVKNPSSDYTIVQPLHTTRYLLKADSPGGTATKEVTVTISSVSVR